MPIAFWAAEVYPPASSGSSGSSGAMSMFGNVSPNQIVQGDIGDCYFLGPLACLAERPDQVS